MPKQPTFLVTGVFISGPGWQREEITRTVAAPYREWAISVVNCEALRADKLFLSAKATQKET